MMIIESSRVICLIFDESPHLPDSHSLGLLPKHVNHVLTMTHAVCPSQTRGQFRCVESSRFQFCSAQRRWTLTPSVKITSSRHSRIIVHVWRAGMEEHRALVCQRYCSIHNQRVSLRATQRETEK